MEKPTLEEFHAMLDAMKEQVDALPSEAGYINLAQQKIMAENALNAAHSSVEVVMRLAASTTA